MNSSDQRGQKENNQLKITKKKEVRFNKQQVEKAGDWEQKTIIDHFRKQKKDKREKKQTKTYKPPLTIKDHDRTQAVNNIKKGIYIKF